MINLPSDVAASLTALAKEGIPGNVVLRCGQEVYDAVHVVVADNPYAASTGYVADPNTYISISLKLDTAMDSNSFVIEREGIPK